MKKRFPVFFSSILRRMGMGLLLAIAFQSSLWAGIRGKIVNDDGDPVDGVRVSLEGQDWNDEQVVGENGIFNFNVSRADIYFLNFNKLGYENKTVTIDLGSGEQRNLDVLLKQLRRLSGYRVQSQSLSAGSERQGVASTRIDREAVVNMRIMKAEDLSGVSANLYSLSSGSSFTSMFTLRGISSVNTIDPLVGLYIDGVAQFQSYNYPITLGNIESVEILKGPQLTLYGRNAMAGIVDIKTKVPPNRFSISGSGEWYSGSYNDFGGQNYDLSFSIPLVKDKAYLKSGGFFSQKNGIFFNSILNQYTDHALNFNAFLRTDMFFSGWEFYLQGKYERVREGAFPYNRDRDEALLRPFFLYHNLENKSEKDIGDAVFSMKTPLRWFDLTSVWNYQYFMGALQIDTDFGLANSSLNLDINQHLITSETKLISAEDSSKYFNWSLGNYMYFQKRDIEAESQLDNLSGNNTLLDIEEINFGIALFMSATYPITESLHFILGLRGDYDYKNVNIGKTDRAVPTQEVTGEDSQEQKKHFFFFTPKAALNFYIDDRNLLYFSVSRGFRSGGINTFTSQPDRLIYEPENTWNGELGIKSRFVPEYNGTLSANFFYIYWVNPQVNVFLATTTDNFFDFGIVNAKSSHSLGAELELDLPIAWGLSVGGAYGYSRSLFLDFVPPGSEQVEGNLQPYVPQHTVSTFLQHRYGFELLSQRDAVVNRFDFRYISGIYYDPENVLYQDGYYLLNYTFNITINGIIGTFWIKNVLDERFFEFALPFGGRLTPKLGDPRAFGGKLSLIF